LGADRKIFLWNTGSATPSKVLEGHKDDIYRVQFNAAGTRLLSVGYSGTIRVWDIATGKPVFELDRPGVTYNGCYLADGKSIAVTGNDGNTHLIDLPPAAH